jgi:hypothetical protein
MCALCSAEAAQHVARHVCLLVFLDVLRDNFQTGIPGAAYYITI